jgi:hypothetical protein
VGTVHAGSKSLGAHPLRDDGLTNWSLIDHDVYPCDVVDMDQRVRAAGLPLICWRSKSGGVQLCAFINGNGIKPELIRGRMAEWAKMLGIWSKDLEIFPKQTELAVSKNGERSFGN